MSDVSPEEGWPTARLWTREGVNGDVLLLINGGVVILHTGDAMLQHIDMLYAGQQPGRPVEMTREQARGLALMILEALGEA